MRICKDYYHISKHGEQEKGTLDNLTKTTELVNKAIGSLRTRLSSLIPYLNFLLLLP